MLWSRDGEEEKMTLSVSFDSEYKNTKRQIHGVIHTKDRGEMIANINEKNTRNRLTGLDGIPNKWDRRDKKRN